MPSGTLTAFADHGTITADAVLRSYPAARAHLDTLERLGIGYQDVTDTLEREGLAKFEKSWDELGRTVGRELHATSR